MELTGLASATSWLSVGILLCILLSLGLSWRQPNKASTEDKNRGLYQLHGAEIIKNLDIGIAIVNKHGKLLTYNLKAQNIFDTNNQKDGAPTTINQAINIEWKPENSSGYQMACFTCKDNERCVVEYMTSKLDTLTENTYITIIRDVTQRIQLDAELSQYRLNLEELVEQRSQALIQARDRAIQAIQEKNTFLANITHELRTPLNAILGYSELLDEDTKDNGHTEYSDDIHKIQYSAQALKGLVEDILDIQEYETGVPDINIKTLDVYNLIQEVCNNCSESIRINQNELSIEIDERLSVIDGDEYKIKKILANLVKNAAKFTEKGKITISANLAKLHNHKFIFISVKDTGIGITEQNINNIFKKFTQADASTTRKYDGAGLGLAISQNLALIMGGDICVESEPGTGSIFKLRLPINPINSAIDPAKVRLLDTPAEVKEKRKVISRVLVFDSNIFTRTLICRYLNHQGFHTDNAKSFHEVKPTIETSQPDVILVNSPENSIYAHRILQDLKHAKLKYSPKIVFCSKDETDLRTQYGISNFAIRPTNEVNLLEIMNGFIQNKQISQHNENSHVLVIDTDPTMEQLIQKTLCQEQQTHHTVTCIEDAFSYIDKQTPDLVIIGKVNMHTKTDSNDLQSLCQHLKNQGIAVLAILSSTDQTTPQENHFDVIDHAIDSTHLGTPEMLEQIKQAVINCVRQGERATESQRKDDTLYLKT